MDTNEETFFFNLQRAIQLERIPELQGLKTPYCFTWRSLFEQSSEKWHNTTMEEKARILGYLETGKRDGNSFLDLITEQFIKYSKKENRKDVIPVIPYSLETIRKSFPQYRDLSPYCEHPTFLDGNPFGHIKEKGLEYTQAQILTLK